MTGNRLASCFVALLVLKASVACDICQPTNPVTSTTPKIVTTSDSPTTDITNTTTAPANFTTSDTPTTDITNTTTAPANFTTSYTPTTDITNTAAAPANFTTSDTPTTDITNTTTAPANFTTSDTLGEASGEDYCITEPTYLSINNGSYSLSNEGVRADTFLLNTVITYYCLDGFFKASGNLTRRCLGGIITNIGNFKNTSAVWSGIGPTCDDIDECNGTNPCPVTAHCVNTAGSYLCTCLTGFTGNGSYCTPVMCAHPGNIENGTISPNQSTYIFNETISYACDPEFYITGSVSRYCSSSGQWYPQVAPSCSLFVERCGILNLLNGSVEVMYDAATMNVTAKFVCDRGFSLMGASGSVCDMNGMWSVRPPNDTCQVINCSIENIGVPMNGFRLSDVYTFGANVTFECSQGYNLIGSNSSQCLLSGNWSTPSPTCQPVDCGNASIPEPTNGFRKGNLYTFGETVLFGCDPGYFRNGSNTSVCQSNTSWSYSPPLCLPVDCGDNGIDAPMNGMRAVTSFTFGQNVTFMCNIGYSLAGSNSSNCLASGKWSSSSPICQLAYCGNDSIPEPTNGFRKGNLYTFGETVLFGCDPGYFPNGNNMSVCQSNASWSHSPPLCLPVDCGDNGIDAPMNGMRAVTSFTFGQNVTFTCNIGYFLVGSSSSNCLAIGRWSASPPTCQPVDCGSASIPEPTNGFRKGNLYTFGETVLFGCDPGYFPDGSNTSVCQSNTSWSHSPPLCLPVNCSDNGIDAPMNGVRAVTSFTFGQNITFMCNRGYFLVGSSSSNCLAIGRWSASPPTCQPVDCGNASIPEPTNGFREGNLYTFGETVLFGCDPGYFPDGSNTSVCQSNTSWSHSPPLCLPVNCSDNGIDAPMNGVRAVTSFTFGQNITFMCNRGYFLVGSSSSNCLAIGRWSASPPTCQPVDCGNASIPEPTNGFREGNLYTFGETVLFGCDPGYFPDGSNTSVCQSNTSWSHSPPLCLPVNCSDNGIDAPMNGVRAVTSFTFGQNITFMCNRGYFLVGSSSSNCLAIGRWSASPPTCQPVDCGNASIPEPTNGFREGNLYTFGETVLFGCDPGYFPDGSNTSVCQSNTSWSHSPPLCLPVNCSDNDIDAPMNGTRAVTSFTFGQNVTFMCNIGYFLVGSDSSNCLASGRWSSSSPTCQPVYCGNDSIPEPTNGTRSGNVFTYGGRLTFTCDLGYNLTGFASSTCLATGQWSSPSPNCVPISCDGASVTAPANGFRDGKRIGDVFTFGQTVIFTCNVGYNLLGANSSECLASADWSALPPVCQPVECGMIEEPQNGARMGEEFTFNKAVAFRCNPGYILLGKNMSLCTASGEWEYPSPSCLPVECEALSVSDRVLLVEGGNRTFGSIFEVQCQDGMEASEGDRRRHCLETGKWNGTSLLCAEPQKSNQESLLWLLLLLLLLIPLVLVIVLWYCKRDAKKAANSPKETQIGTFRRYQRSLLDVVSFGRKDQTPSSSAFIEEEGQEIESALPPLDNVFEDPVPVTSVVSVETESSPPQGKGATARLPSRQFSIGSLAVYSKDAEALREEYRTIPMNMATEEDIPPGSGFKNRYLNVLPNAHSRVPLPLLFDSPHSDYINANFVRGFQQRPRQYIAAQGPLLETTSDFWRMIWAQKTAIIVMLTQFEEKGKIKCECYWPMKVGGSEKMDDLTVTCLRKAVEPHYTVTEFNVLHTKRNIERRVHHFWFTAWPDHGVPEKTSMLSFIEAISPLLREAKTPNVIHCSAGIGRTGAFIAIDTGLQEIDANGSCDVLRIVSSMREDRGGMVQNQVQYLFVYEVLNYYAQLKYGKAKTASENLYENMGAIEEQRSKADHSGREPDTGGLETHPDHSSSVGGDSAHEVRSDVVVPSDVVVEFVGDADTPAYAASPMSVTETDGARLIEADSTAEINAGFSNTSMFGSTTTTLRKQVDKVIDDLNVAVDFFDDQI